MKYFIDTEFIEGFKKPIKWLPTIGNFNKTYHSIQLISIGIVCEDGREYYAISNEYNYSDASEWVKENVIVKMFQQLPPFKKAYMDPSTFHKYLSESKTNNQIAIELREFCNPSNGFLVDWFGEKHGRISDHCGHDLFQKMVADYGGPEFYAYYADYDWVVFCSLFGTMMDLPKGFPMYCRDLKQTMDSWVEKNMQERPTMYAVSGQLDSFEIKLKHLKGHCDYPKQTNEHNALDDSKWNLALYKFLKSL